MTSSLLDDVADLSDLTDEELEILQFIHPMMQLYPRLTSWYVRCVIPDFRRGKRRIIAHRRQTAIVAVGIGKISPEERKICTLYLLPTEPEATRLQIIKELMLWVGTFKPVFSFSDVEKPIYEPLLDQLEWRITSVSTGRYRPKAAEYFCNEPNSPWDRHGLVAARGIGQSTYRTIRPI